MHPLISKLLHGILNDCEDHLTALEEEITRLTEELAVLTTLRDYLRRHRRDPKVVNGETKDIRVERDLSALSRDISVTIGQKESLRIENVILEQPGAEPSREPASDSTKSGEDGPQLQERKSRLKTDAIKRSQLRVQILKHLFENGPMQSDELRVALGLSWRGPHAYSNLVQHEWFDAESGGIKLTTLGHQEARRLNGGEDD